MKHNEDAKKIDELFNYDEEALEYDDVALPVIPEPRKHFTTWMYDILAKGEGQVIDKEYIELLVNAFGTMLANDESASDESLIAFTKTFSNIMNCAVHTKDAAKIASMFMAQTSGAKDLTLAHTNILLTVIGLAFREGNKILYHISKYNSHITNLCIEKMNALIGLAEARSLAGTDSTSRQQDLNAVAELIKKQFMAL